MVGSEVSLRFYGGAVRIRKWLPLAEGSPQPVDKSLIARRGAGVNEEARAAGRSEATSVDAGEHRTTIRIDGARFKVADRDLEPA